MEFTGLAQPLTQAGMSDVTDLLAVEPADVWTVVSVETRGCGFLSDRRPAILFERHIFRKQTNAKYDQTNPGISAPAPGGYLGGAREYDRLAEALALDSHAALLSTSWGIGQIMGLNAAAAGYDTVEAMVAAFVDSEDAQLGGVAQFLKASSLAAALAGHDWTTFARGYNGPGFAKNHYDQRLLAAFQMFSNGALPDITVRQVQILLMFLGIDTGGIDGIQGPRTRSGIQMFRSQHGLAASDEIDDTFLAALVAAAGAATHP